MIEAPACHHVASYLMRNNIQMLAVLQLHKSALPVYANTTMYHFLYRVQDSGDPFCC